MGGLICCIWRMFCCECTMCEKKDDWKIDSEIRPGENGAGWLYKRAKNSAMWSKRYFVITDNKLIYYMERDRLAMKGEIILPGATALVSTTRADSKKKFYFNIVHPQCGVREMYTKSRSRRAQWMNKINDVVAAVSARAVFGKLLKQGGLSKNVWQERWCICSKNTIDYFDAPTDNQCKGSLVVTGAVITPVLLKDKYAFEISSSGGKKGGKKYVFAADKEHERDRWVEALRKAAADQLLVPVIAIAPGTSNPMQQMPADSGSAAAAQGQEDEDGEEVAVDAAPARPSLVASADLKGYLFKKSPNMMKGWQKRYFITQANGDLHYFKSEEEQSGGGAEKGQIRLVDIKSVTLNEKSHELTVHTQLKDVHLKANNFEDATDWARNITAWLSARG